METDSMDKLNNQTEKLYIARCKVLIEEKLNWPGSQEWKQRDYENLSELIFSKTQILLSLSTLKRVWKNGYDSLPHPSTLNALAMFLGYVNWMDFKRDQFNFINQERDKTGEPLSSSQKKQSLKRSRTRAAALLGLITVVLLFYAFFDQLTSQHNYEDVVFNSKKAITNGLPNSVIFDYDISSIKSDSVFIQQSWNEKQRAVISKKNRHHTSIYYYPGFHKAKLIVDNTIIRQKNIHITTDGWLGIVRHSLDDPIPVYLPRDKIFDKTRLYASPEILQANNVQVSRGEFFVSFFYVHDFGNIDGDNFVLESQVKNDLSDGGLTCQYADVIIMCENGRMVIPLSMAGCVSNNSLKFIDVYRDGKENDLSKFGCDMSVWNNLRCEVRNREVNLSLNGKKIYTLSYQEPAGRVIGLHYIFYGAGSVNKVILYDQDKNIVFSDDFVQINFSQKIIQFLYLKIAWGIGCFGNFLSPQILAISFD